MDIVAHTCGPNAWEVKAQKFKEILDYKPDMVHMFGILALGHVLRRKKVGRGKDYVCFYIWNLNGSVYR